MDTTLRDGEQTSGVSYTHQEKLNIAKLLLEEVNLDRIEIASARVSEGEFKGAATIMEWAKAKNYLDRIEILGFVDGNLSIDWIKKVGGKVLNLLCKGSHRHPTIHSICFGEWYHHQHLSRGLVERDAEFEGLCVLHDRQPTT